MATKRIYNLTGGTLILGSTYRLFKDEISPPIPDDDPIFKDAGVRRCLAKKAIAILSDSDHVNKTELKKQIKQIKTVRASTGDDIRQTYIAQNKADEEKKVAKIKEDIKRAIDSAPSLVNFGTDKIIEETEQVEEATKQPVFEVYSATGRVDSIDSVNTVSLSSGEYSGKKNKKNKKNKNTDTDTDPEDSTPND